MSFLLDALKKLERERRSGKVPDLSTNHTPPTGGKGRRRLWLIILPAAVVIGAAVTLIWLKPWPSKAPETAPQLAGLQDPAPPAPETASEEPEAPVVMEESAPPDQPELPAAAETPKTEAPPSTISQPIAEAPPAPVSQPNAEAAPTSPGPPKAENPPAPPAAGPKDTIEIIGTPTAPAQAEAKDASPNVKVARTKKGKKESKKSASTGESSPAVEKASPPVSTGVAPAGTSTPLPAEDIPDIRLTGHVYSNDPGLRLVIMDSVVRREGDLISDGLRLQEITQDGAVFSDGNRTFTIYK